MGKKISQELYPLATSLQPVLLPVPRATIQEHLC